MQLYPYRVLEVNQIMQRGQVIDWSMQLVDAPEAWKVTKGEGIRVAVLDTGIDYRHPDLTQNIEKGINFTSFDRYDYMDWVGHGTHVAGLIAGCDNNIGVIGVAPRARLVAVKVLGDNGFGSIDAIIKGIEYCISEKVDIISMSLGTQYDPGPQLRRVIQKAREAGIIIVAASGNESSFCGWPARYDEVIAVGAIDYKRQKASFSNIGPELDVVAPGVSVLSTYPNGKYARLSGTSMATPIVAGIIALIQTYARKLGKKLGPGEIMKMLPQLTLDLGQAGPDPQYGYGMISLSNLVDKFNEGLC